MFRHAFALPDPLGRKMICDVFKVHFVYLARNTEPIFCAT
jgi:hypothetical protein